MTNHQAHIFYTISIFTISVLLAVTMLVVWRVDGSYVGHSPEGFQRLDAMELMEALCLMNDDMRCPDPYALPRYEYRQQQIEGASSP